MFSTDPPATACLPPNLAGIVLLISLTACGGGGGGGGGETSGGQPAQGGTSAPILADQTGSEPLPRVLQLLEAETDLLSPVPGIAHTQTMADSGLQISYTDGSLRTQAPPSTIERQWTYMQECVGQSAEAPLIIVREGLIAPFTFADDVVRNEQLEATEITSIPIASASTLHGPVIQISLADFDGSLGTPLFNLRSIIGRYLWLSANLPERDYPFACARQQP